LFVKVSVDTKDTKVESAPAGNNITFVTPAECGWDFNICPCELDSQLNCIAPAFVLPLTVTWPVPLGANSKSAFEVVTISEPFKSRLPPNWGVLSSDTFDIAPDVANPDTTADLAIFLRPPPEVSIAKNTSSLATVDISDKPPTATELKFVPSATKILPAVFVPIVISSPDTVRSPDIVKFLSPVKSLLESTITALDALTVPAVIPSTKFNSVAVEVTVVPFIDKASVSNVPSISASPEISNVAASNSPERVILVAPVIAPFKATAPLISTVVAAICISVSATKSNWPSADELIYIAVSLNCNFSVVVTNKSSENWK